MPTTSSRTTRSRRISSSCCSGSSSPFAGPARPGFTLPKANVRCSTPFSRPARQLPIKKSACWCRCISSIQRSRAFWTPRSNARLTSGENPSLEPFDIRVLEVLFLIRYVDEIKGNVDNLVTLCLNEIDADRLGLKRQIEDSLRRLEKETLISRSGDNYFFLTNEERDINREIKAMDLSSGEEAKLLGELIFEEVLRGQRKHRFSANKMDFTFNRICDLHPIGNRVEGGLVVSFITPLGDDYELYNEGRCIGASGEENGQVLIRLGDNEALARELRTYLKTDKYLRTHDDGTLPATTRRIHRDLAEENRHRRDRMTALLADLVGAGAYYVAGQRYEPSGATAPAALDGALEYLIRNTFNKMSFLAHLHDNPLHEIQALLRSDDVAQQSLAMDLPENNPQATKELRGHLELVRAHQPKGDHARHDQ